MHDNLGRGWLTIDKKEILNMPSITYEIELYQRAQHINHDCHRAGKDLHKDNLFSQSVLHQALFEYLNLAIEDILKSDNPIIRAVGMLDSRTGIRRLKQISIENEHDLVKRLYLLRCDSESISAPEGIPGKTLTSHITGKWFRKSSRQNSRSQVETTAYLKKSKGTRNIRMLLNLIENGEIDETQLDTEYSKELMAGLKASGDKKLLLGFLRHLLAKSKLLGNIKYLKGAIELARDSVHWIRPYTEWLPASYNMDLQFSSLARHCWAAYEVPVFMDCAWWTGNRLHQEWFKHIAGGKNIRRAPSLPFPFTKKIAHHFHTAPRTYSIEAAIRWGEVHALGGDARISNALLETRLVREFRDNSFWKRVLDFFVRNPMLDTAHINPIIDYIWSQKYDDRVIFVERGVAENCGPAQPNFSMNGRTAESLLRAVQAWHRQLGKEVKGGDLQWKESGLDDFQHIEGSPQKKNMTVWKIRELLSSGELIAEGRQMRHCVASYAQSCAKGICSIWTMDSETEQGIEKRVTIEINRKQNEILQVRGKMNRKPTEKEKDILNRWAAQAGLEIAAYLK
jgi:hypothetical protein